MTISTSKFTSVSRFGATNKNMSVTILISCTRIDADKDSGKGYIISASASYINGEAAPAKSPTNPVDKPIVRPVDGSIGLS